MTGLPRPVGQAVTGPTTGRDRAARVLHRNLYLTYGQNDTAYTAALVEKILGTLDAAGLEVATAGTQADADLLAAHQRAVHALHRLIPHPSRLGRMACAECSNAEAGVWVVGPCPTLQALNGTQP